MLEKVFTTLFGITIGQKPEQRRWRLAGRASPCLPWRKRAADQGRKSSKDKRRERIRAAPTTRRRCRSWRPSRRSWTEKFRFRTNVPRRSEVVGAREATDFWGSWRAGELAELAVGRISQPAGSMTWRRGGRGPGGKWCRCVGGLLRAESPEWRFLGSTCSGWKRLEMPGV